MLDKNKFYFFDREDKEVYKLFLRDKILFEKADMDWLDEKIKNGEAPSGMTNLAANRYKDLINEYMLLFGEK